jgi:hypothetical protein
MTPPVLPSLPGLAWSRHKKPGFSTRVASHVSGREVRLALMSYPLYEFEAAYAGLASSAAASIANLGASSLQTLMGFFLQSLGQAGVFLYTDPDDNTVLGQSIGFGDGTTQQFIVSRTLGGFTEPVSYVTAVNAVYLNGAAQPSNGWLFTAPNMLAFASPPGAGAAITADFTFAFQCRFFDDQLDFEEFMSALWKLDSVKFRSIKPNTSASGAVIPSWYTPYQVGGSIPYAFADFTTQGTTNHYLYNGNTYSSGAAWLTAAGGSYSNSTGKYVTNSSGLLASVAANTLPFNHDASGNPLGLSLEGPSTNYATYSGDLTNSAWGKDSCTATTGAADATGGTAGATILASAGNTYHFIQGNVAETVTSGNTYTHSFFVAQGTAPYALVGEANASATSYAWATLKWSDLSISTNGQLGVSATVSGPYNGLYRIALTFTANWGATFFAPRIGPSFATAAAIGNANYTLNAAGTESVIGWGLQIGEHLPFASSYIPTTSSTASRAADSLYLPWTATTFTARVKATMLSEQDNGRLMGAGSGGLLYEAPGPNATTNNGSNVLSTAVNSWTAQNMLVIGGSPSGRVLSANGSAATTDGNALVPSAPSHLYLGAESGGSNYGFGNYAQIGLHTVAPTAAQAAALSGLA